MFQDPGLYRHNFWKGSTNDVERPSHPDRNLIFLFWASLGKVSLVCLCVREWINEKMFVVSGNINEQILQL